MKSPWRPWTGCATPALDRSRTKAFIREEVIRYPDGMTPTIHAPAPPEGCWTASLLLTNGFRVDAYGGSEDEVRNGVVSKWADLDHGTRGDPVCIEIESPRGQRAVTTDIDFAATGGAVARLVTHLLHEARLGRLDSHLDASQRLVAACIKWVDVGQTLMTSGIVEVTVVRNGTHRVTLLSKEEP